MKDLTAERFAGLGSDLEFTNGRDLLEVFSTTQGYTTQLYTNGQTFTRDFEEFEDCQLHAQSIIDDFEMWVEIH
jgi:hypothetical protein